MSGSVDQVDEIFLPIGMSVDDRNRLRLDGDSSLPLDFELVQELWGGAFGHSAGHLHISKSSHGEGSSHLQQAICQRRFAMIDVSDYGQVSVCQLPVDDEVLSTSHLMRSGGNSSISSFRFLLEAPPF